MEMQRQEINLNFEVTRRGTTASFHALSVRHFPHPFSQAAKKKKKILLHAK